MMMVGVIYSLLFWNLPDNHPRTQFSTLQLTPFMQLLKPLMHWPSLHPNRICDPPSSHRRKLGLTNYSKNIVISEPNYWSFFNHFTTGLL